MIKLKYFSLVFIILSILSSCENTDDENITPIERDIEFTYDEVASDSLGRKPKVKLFTDLPQDGVDNQERKTKAN